MKYYSRWRVQMRRFWDSLALALSLIAIAFGLLWLGWILWTTLKLGLGGWSWSLLTAMTPPPNGADSGGGGLANAIAGSVLLVGLATFISAPLGILAGIYLAEYGRRSPLAEVVRFINDILLCAPSIVMGLFVYALFVAPFGHFSGWAGAVALALLQIPIILRTTENMLKLIPDSLREAAFALGAPKWKMIGVITLKAAASGIVTGLLLAIARIAGETAPLLFTVLSNRFFSVDLSRPMATLPVTIFQFAMSPYAHWQQLAWAGVLLITLSILGLNIGARFVFKKKKTGF